MKDILKDILENYNIWHYKQKRMVNRAGGNLNNVKITKIEKRQEKEKGK